MKLRSAVFLDFQGTIGGNGIDDITNLKLYPFTGSAIKHLNDNDILVIGITNQSHISKGKITMEDFNEKLKIIEHQLSLEGAHFDAVYCCPHASYDKCTCRKPLAGLIQIALKSFHIDISSSFVIGDMGMSDMILANNIGAKGILVLTGVGNGSLSEFRDTWKDYRADYICKNLLSASKLVTSLIIK